MGQELIFFHDAMNSERACISSLTPGQADAFVKIVSIISEFTDKIQIEDSRIITSISNTVVIDVPLKKIIGDDIDMYFYTNRKLVSDLKGIKKKLDLIILNDIIYQRYIFSNGQQVVIGNRSVIEITPTIPNTSPDNVWTISKNLDVDEGALISHFSRKSSYIDIHVFGKQIGFFERQDGKQYHLGDFSVFEFEEMIPNYIFRSYNFLPVSDHHITFGITEFKNHPGLYCFKTTVNTGFNMIFYIYERVNRLEVKK